MSRLRCPGRLEEVQATADDGQPIRAWLVLPPTASADRPAPLLLWVHGGPMSSWNSWSWRWNPHLMAARGYAVLLPDPALSTGYGLAFIARGHRDWGARPFADIMAVTDAALARPDIDADRVGMMGGSYGGYMANWMAGHTDRFKAIVSHAGLWTLEAMFGTTDHPMFWRPQFGDPLTSPAMYEANSPHRHIGQIRTPMLVIHGNKDYRVPVGEALRLWWDLSRHGRRPSSSTSLTRTTGSSPRATRGSGTRRSSPSWPSTSSASPGSAPRCSSPVGWPMSEPKGRGAAWTDERGTSEEGRRRLEGAPEASGKQSRP